MPPNSLFHRENTGNFRFGANQGSLRPIKNPTILRRFLENSLIDGTGNFTLPNRERKFVDQRICQGSSENTIAGGTDPNEERLWARSHEISVGSDIAPGRHEAAASLVLPIRRMITPHDRKRRPSHIISIFYRGEKLMNLRSGWSGDPAQHVGEPSLRTDNDSGICPDDLGCFYTERQREGQ